MRLITFTSSTGDPHVGVMRDQSVIDLSIWLSQGAGHSGSSLDMLHLISLGEAGRELCNAALQSSESSLESIGALLPLDMARLLAPLPRPRKNVLCLGRNYPEHAAESRRAAGETDQPAPEFPIIFTKSPTTVAPPFGELSFNFGISKMLDWEVELGFVIGRTGRDIGRSEAMQYIYGYLVINDLTARDIQRRHGNQFFKGKSLDQSCPCGPWLVTADEISDPSNLRLWTRVNSVEKQSGHTGDMYCDVPGIVEALSEGMTLEPGDMVATGTPAGVGHARTPAEYLRPGDVVECEVERIGMIRNSIAER